MRQIVVLVYAGSNPVGHPMIEKAKKLLRGAHECSFCGYVGFEKEDNPVREFFHHTKMDPTPPFDYEGYYFWLCEECNKAGRDFSNQ